MDRLTKRSNKTVHENGVCCTHYLSEECEERSGYCTDECPWEEAAWSKLADYEDAEEQGLLLRLPCKEGTVVYEIRNNTDACYDCPHYSDFYGMDAMCDKVKTKNISGPRYADEPLCEKQFLEIIEFKANLDFVFRHRNDFGKTVFLTREEAESALAEKGGAE